MSARPLPMPTNPALLRHAEQRRKSLENRIADRITRFAGPTRNARSWPTTSGRPSSKKNSRTSSCCSCPTRSWSSPGPSTP